MSKKNRLNSSDDRDILSILNSRSVIGGVIVIYALLILFLLFAESGIPWLSRYRATDTVLILLGLLFLPFFIMVSAKMIRSFTVKWAGKELQIDLGEFSEKVEGEFARVEKKIASQVSSAEQALWPMLAGRNHNAPERRRNKKIIIGSKQDLSHVFLANFLAEWLQRKLDGVSCEARIPNGGSLKNFADAQFDWIDLYIDFTGTCCQYFNIEHKNKSDHEIADELNRHFNPIGLKMLNLLGATENYCLVISKELAKERELKTVSDLSKISNSLVFTADPEYLNRRDCYLGLKSEYNFNFRQIHPCRITQRYALLEDRRADVFVGYETDPEIQTYGLVVLEDDKEFFPHYAAAPLVSIGALESIPGLENALNDLAGKITTDNLIEEVRKLSVSEANFAKARKFAVDFCDQL